MTLLAKEARPSATRGQKCPHCLGTLLPPQPQDSSWARKGTALTPCETPEPCRPLVSSAASRNHTEHRSQLRVWGLAGAERQLLFPGRMLPAPPAPQALRWLGSALPAPSRSSWQRWPCSLLRHAGLGTSHCAGRSSSAQCGPPPPASSLPRGAPPAVPKQRGPGPRSLLTPSLTHSFAFPQRFKPSGSSWSAESGFT